MTCTIPKTKTVVSSVAPWTVSCAECARRFDTARLQTIWSPFRIHICLRYFELDALRFTLDTCRDQEIRARLRYLAPLLHLHVINSMQFFQSKNFVIEAFSL
ncbi:unnamed protein product [Albugo candida]|uniref:Uncharacterized protein n=1 Tax=Albugo candida TaxID=65357 RepID=A0A024GRS1_9STRA|nr:unnamed protein product [Albugo candida]|eukprot:CCI49055.1 unnamed protein product [Albugo candida]